jgi:hypothetical protein
MSYLEKFIEAARYRNELFPNEKPLDIGLYKKYSMPENLAKNDLYDFKEISLDFLGDLYCYGINIDLSCHIISNNFKKYLQERGYNDNEIAVTIGDVSYHGKYEYNVNREKLLHILNEGKKLGATLDLHVWITYKSTYVFDPTIKSNLRISTDRNNLEKCLLS